MYSLSYDKAEFFCTDSARTKTEVHILAGERGRFLRINTLKASIAVWKARVMAV